jgi:hypothetical protein
LKIYFSAKANSFYRDDFHGSRKISIQDPDWVRPDIEVENPEWTEDSVDVPETILIPNMSIYHPLVEVLNPSCLLPPEDELVEITEEEHQAIQELIATTCSVLSSDKNGRPTVIPAPGPTAEQVLAGALLQRDRLINSATTRINPLQDAVDLEEASSEEVALLKKWKQYRVAVNRVAEQEGFPAEITWPSEPQ